MEFHLHRNIINLSYIGVGQCTASLAQPTQRSQPPSSHLCQLIIAKLLQDNSIEPARWGTTPCWQPEGQMGEQVVGQSAEQRQPKASHFHTSWHAAAKLCAKETGDSSGDGGVWKWDISGSHCLPTAAAAVLGFFGPELGSSGGSNDGCVYENGNPLAATAALHSVQPFAHPPNSLSICSRELAIWSCLATW